jgi:hypothetical protein
MSSRLASISSFSANGSPTWTRALRRVVVAEGGAREHGRARRSRRARSRAEQHDEVARARAPPRGEQPLLEQPDGHDVDERVAAVARVEDELAADVGTPTQLP